MILGAFRTRLVNMQSHILHGFCMYLPIRLCMYIHISMQIITSAHIIQFLGDSSIKQRLNYLHKNYLELPGGHSERNYTWKLFLYCSSSMRIFLKSNN